MDAQDTRKPCANCDSTAFANWPDPDGVLVCEACRVDDDVLVPA